jgi:hypothetical protein
MAAKRRRGDSAIGRLALRARATLATGRRPLDAATAMDASEFDEIEFFRALGASGARALLIGRRALVVLGLPVLTADYDLWVHIDDSALLNRAAEPFGLSPTRTPDDARRHGRYVLENDERVDVLVARVVPTVDGVRVSFDDLWSRRREIALTHGVKIDLPSLDDLILTKRFAARPKDLEDIRLLEILRTQDVP